VFPTPSVPVLATTVSDLVGVPPLDLYLWLLALLVFGVGDAVTTAVAVGEYDMVEANPLVVRLAGDRPSVAATVGFKTAVLLAGVATYLALRPLGGRFPALAVPIVLLGVGCWAVAANVVKIGLAKRRGRGRRR
jgi:hypothetical protein